MALVNLQTNLKSLRYGKDRIGGGSSNQPYIKSDIPDGENGLGRKGGPDFLLRGGLLTPGRAVNDVSRLTQMFFDFKSPNGLLFTAKQNILSRSAVATQASGKALNEGIYLPTSTILGAAGNPLGIHLNKQGLDPTKRTGPDAGQSGLFDLLGVTDPLGLPVYNSIVTPQQEYKKNRLFGLYRDTIESQTNGNPTLYSYNGGPGSVLGVGKTNIKIAKDRTGLNNPYLNYVQQGKTFDLNNQSNDIILPSLSGTPIQTGVSYTTTSVVYKGSKYNSPSVNRGFQSPSEGNKNIQYKFGVSTKYFQYLPDQNAIKLTYNDTTATESFKFSVYNPNSLDTNLLLQSNKDSNTYTLTQQQITEKTSSKFSPKIGEDFRKETGNPNPIQTLSYLNKNIEQRVNLGNPGKLNKNPDTTPLDTINSRVLYKTTENNPIIPETNDLVKFRIGVIQNDNPEEKVNIHFRAFIDGMNDSYSADWQSQKFMGRGENFYRYNGFDRKISLSWTVAAQSKAELIPMYQKLNYLASVCAPDYSKTGYMRGNLITLTVGGYLYEQVGIMTGINYDVPTESPWEIAIPYRTNLEGNNGGVSSDSTVKEMPHMIKVTGFNFIPIHNFVPRVQNNDYEGPNRGISKYGDERYIALNNGFNNNYDTNNYTSS